MPRSHYTIYENPSDTRVIEMEGARPNPAYDIDQDQWDKTDPMLRDAVYLPAAHGLQQYARHLDSVMGDLWPPLSQEKMEKVTAFLADIGGELLAQDSQGAVAALRGAVDDSVHILPEELQPQITHRSNQWKEKVARILWHYLGAIIIDNENTAVEALRDANALPEGAEELPDGDIDVTEAMQFWLGEVLQMTGAQTDY